MNNQNDRWQDEIVRTLGFPSTAGEVRDLLADAAFEEISQKTYLAAQSAKTEAQALAIEKQGYVRAVQAWESHYEDWELEKLNKSSASFRFKYRQ